MDMRVAKRIEAIASVGAAAILAVAVAFAASQLTASVVTGVAGAAAAFFVTGRILRSVAPNPNDLPLAEFEPAGLIFEELDELVLTDADRIDHAPPAGDDDVLLLDDVLAGTGHGSRVVRLFDASKMPSPGQLKDRIDRHLSRSRDGGPDASGALHDALAELRRSLK
jgi:hypothetical protein